MPDETKSRVDGQEVSAPVLYRMDGRIVELTLNRPDKRNALNADMAEQLRMAISRAASDGARAVLLVARGTAFSAGADLAALQALRTASYEENLADSQVLAGLFRAIRTAPFPVVAAVQGHAIAGGAGLVAAADYAVIADDALVGFTEVRIGFVPAIIMHFVDQRLGDAALRDLLFSGRLIDGTTAVSIGLANESCPSESVATAAREWADKVANRTSSSAVARTKKLIGEIRGMSLDEALDHAAAVNAEARSTPDCQAGVDAFVRGEKPPWHVEDVR